MDVIEFQDKLLTEAMEAGFKDVELYYEKSESFGCRIYKGELDHYETSDDGGLSFRGLFGGKMGYAYTEKLDEASISFLIEHAKSNAVVLDEDDGSEIFAGSETYAGHDFFEESLETVSIPDKIALMKEIEAKVLAFDPRIQQVNYCGLNDESTQRILANSKGLSLSEKSNGLGLYVSAVAKEGEEVKTGSAIRITQDFATLNADEIAKEAAEKAIASLGGQSIPGGKYRVLMENGAAAQLLATYSSIFSAENTQKDLSLLKGKTGTKIAAETVTVLDDPFNRQGSSVRNFDSEGVATKRTAVISNGTLETLLHNRKTAKKDGVETTGHAYKHSYKGTLTVAPSNFYIEAGSKSFDELVASMEEGVLITDLAGLHSGANTVSGDFSLAAGGYHIKDGKIASTLKLMTIAGNYFDYLNNIETVGSDLEFRHGGFGAPSLLVKELSVTVD